MERTEPALAGGYRLVRRLATGDRCVAWLASPGADDADADGPVVVRAYPPGHAPDAVALEAEAMARTPGGVLPALLDAASDGESAWLVVEQLEIGLPELLERRAWAPGEAVTLLAGVREALLALDRAGLALARLAPGQVMLDRAGRPRLIGLGALRRAGDAAGGGSVPLRREAMAAYAGLVRALAARVARPDGLDGLAAWCDAVASSRPFARDDAAWERAVFAVAAPAPIRLDASAGLGRADAPLQPSAVELDGPRSAESPTAVEAAPDDGSGGHAAAWAGILQLPEESAAAWERALDDGIAGRIRTALRARRRPLVVGGAVAASALVLALTLLPPVGAADAVPGAGEEVSVVPDGGPVTGEWSDDGAWQPPGPDVEAAAAARSLLEERIRCLAARSAGCLGRVLQPGSALERDDLAALRSADDGAELHASLLVPPAEVVVVDELGDVVLVQVTSTVPDTPPASALVVRGEAGWSLRSIWG
ncbi:protein kinase family protein [Agromyces mangrovi Wang et al. 2018]|uniref:hypothetical protein n=1 Tax=Agromyces mangrovi TaxID=1858653 RepID=UPI0025733C2A|nr:hypothetical protein [Agromyces mangrovi]